MMSTAGFLIFLPLAAFAAVLAGAVIAWRRTPLAGDFLGWFKNRSTIWSAQAANREFSHSRADRPLSSLDKATPEMEACNIEIVKRGKP